MIKCDKGKIEIKGSIRDILSDFSFITHAVYYLFSKHTSKEAGKVFVNIAVELALLSKEELNEKFKEITYHISNNSISSRDDIMSIILIDLLECMEE